MKDIRV